VSELRQAIKIGLIGGVVAVLLSLIGMVETFSQRDVISRVLSMGHSLLLLIGVAIGYFSARRSKGLGVFSILINSLLSGVLVAVLLCLLIFLGHAVNLRSVFRNASPVLYEFLAFNQGLGLGCLWLLSREP